MPKQIYNEKTFFGTTTVGEKGQMVIPVEARQKMNLKKGDKMLVFGIHDDIIACFKVSNIEKFASELESRLVTLQTLIKKTKNK